MNLSIFVRAAVSTAVSIGTGVAFGWLTLTPPENTYSPADIGERGFYRVALE